jgi:L-alanine-DL-glutamate epimerase-like enolase superfamily enzyme
VHELLGGAQRKTIVPYASLQPAGHGFAEYRDALVESARDAKRLGFKAVKSEVTMNGPYAHGGMKIVRPPYRSRRRAPALVRTWC